MPRPSREPSHAQQATELLDQAADPAMDPAGKAALHQAATAYALVSIAKELAGIRDQIGGVEMALRGPDEHGVGISLHYISDWLEKISRK